jgi:hypothetical protein
MLDRHFLRLITQDNTNSDLIPDEPDDILDEEDVPVLDRWTERVKESNMRLVGIKEFETAFDGEVEAIADILEYITHNQIPGDVTIHPNAKAASEKQKGRTSIAWLKERISQYYTMAKDTEAEKGKHSIIPPPPPPQKILPRPCIESAL